MNKFSVKVCLLYLLLICAVFSLFSCGRSPVGTGASVSPSETFSETEPKLTETPSEQPTEQATVAQTEAPTEAVTSVPTDAPTALPTFAPTDAPTEALTEKATEVPTAAPTEKNTELPTSAPTELPTAPAPSVPTDAPTEAPTELPTFAPTAAPTDAPTEASTAAPTEVPTDGASEAPTDAPTEENTLAPEVEALLETNELSAILSSSQTVGITVERFGADHVLTTAYDYTYHRDAEGALTLDLLQTDPLTQSVCVQNYVCGALYAQEADGSLRLGILPLAIEEAYLFSLAPDISSQNMTLSVFTEERISLVATYEKEGVLFEFVYDFDPVSRLLTYGEQRATQAGGTLLSRVEIRYEYGIADDDSDSRKAAYHAILSSDAEKRTVHVVEVSESGEKQAARNYTFASDAELFLLGDGYAFYKNAMCSADVDDVGAYLTEEDRDTLYLSEKRAEISFAYTLTEEDFTAFKASLSELETLALEGNDTDRFERLFEEVSETYLYFNAQADAGYLLYCLDQHNPDTQELYTYSHEVRANALMLFRNFLAKVYNSSTWAKEIVFAGWTEEELEEFFGTEDHEREILDLQNENEQLTVLFYDLIGNGTPPWDEDAVAELYVQLVENNQSLAVLHGYDNYYNYAAEEIFGRIYTAEEREAFREYVAIYIVPLLVHTFNRYDELSEDLNIKQYLAYRDLLTSPYSERSEGYMQGYIDSYGGELSKNMNALFEKEAVLFAENEGSLSGAFVSYSDFYEEPYAYFGVGYQDILSLVHELGHYASLYTYSLEDMSYDLAETHSQGNEWMFLAYLEDQLDPSVAEMIVTYRLYSGLLSIVYATMVDEFEDIVYHAQTPFEAAELEAIVATLAEKYGGEELLNSMSSLTPYQYVQYVTFSAPVYYLNYATSEMVSISLYVEAHESYENAQDLYRALQEDADTEKSFIDNIEAMGFKSPFEATLYEDLCELFGVTVTVTQDVYLP